MNRGDDSTPGLSADAPGADHQAAPRDGEDAGPPATPAATVTIIQGATDGAATDHGRAAAPVPAPDLSGLPRRPLTASEAVVGVTAILAWGVLVAVGVAIPTKPYIDLLSSPDGNPSVFALTKAMFVILTCYTFTNVAALCCLSAVVGAIGRSARIDDVERNDPATDLRTLCLSAVIRGFFLFLAVLSGTLFVSEQKFDNISIEQYLKLAGLVSLLSFAIGYDPHLFVAFFARVSQWTNTIATTADRR
jgi:hypothetical protein